MLCLGCGCCVRHDEVCLCCCENPLCCDKYPLYGKACIGRDTPQTSDVDSRMRLYEHVVLSGGNTMFPGLTTRLERELKDLYCSNVLKERVIVD